jgi:hypothetical protein
MPTRPGLAAWRDKLRFSAAIEEKNPAERKISRDPEISRPFLSHALHLCIIDLDRS